jgi:hypothetical protein
MEKLTNHKWPCILLLLNLSFNTSNAQLKSVVYDFDGLDISSTNLPDGDYYRSDLRYSVAANPLAANDMIGDRVLKLNLTWSSGYGTFGKSIGRFVEMDRYADYINFFFYNPVSNNQSATFEISIGDDDNQNGTYEIASDDTWKKSVTVSGAAGWQLISIPLSSFTDGNSGGNGSFDIAYTSNKGMLLNSEFKFTRSSSTLSNPVFYIDMISYSQGPLPHGTSNLELPAKTASDRCLLGVYHSEDRGDEHLMPEAIESLFPNTGKKLKYIHSFLNFSNDGSHVANELPGNEFQILINNGYTPIITWEPMFKGYSKLDPVQPDLDNIIHGDYDSYIDAFASIVKTYTDTLIIRFMHEFDGNWYSWSLTNNSEDPVKYISAYRHVVDRFRARGATKVKWMWCVNLESYPSESYNWMVSAYPGNSYIDIVAADIYNNHYPSYKPYWKSFRAQAAETYYYLTKYFPTKPLFICEMGCRERLSSENTSSESKASWYARMDKELQSNFRKVRGLIFYDSAPDQNWFINSSSSALTSLINNIWYDNYYFIAPPSSNCSGTGSITKEIWNGISGNLVSYIPVNSAPSATTTLSSFEAPQNIADNYGQRIKGFVCPPVTGNYTFWISGDDNCELWLSTNDQAANKQKIAYVSGWTSSREWTKYSSQQSVVKYLTAGQKYYIEALHKESAQGDNLAVGWQLPSGVQERPIPGMRLIPFSAAASSTELIAAGASWKYLANGSNQGTSWKNISFNDNSWNSGNAELGYGDGGEATVVNYGSSSSNKYITTYFRKSFSVSSTSNISGLELSLIRDDGAIVYLNGTEINRTNMPSGTVYYNTPAAYNVDGTAESTYIVTNVSSSALVTGTNVIAVEIHQQSGSSSDISFNLKLKTIASSLRSEDEVPEDNSTPDCVSTIKAGSATTFCPGGNVTLYSDVTAGYTFQWIMNGNEIPNATSRSYITKTDGDYQLRISNEGCTAWSAPMEVSVTSSLTARITIEGKTSFCKGGNVKLYANTCKDYLYQWKRDGEDIPGATSDNYTADIPGSYQVMIVNGSSVAWSSYANITLDNCDAEEKENNLENAVASIEKEPVAPQQFNNFLRVSVYPNPTTGMFNFDYCLEDNSEAELEVRVLNAVGQTVYSTPPTRFSGCLKETIELDGNLATGVYFLQVRIGNRTENVKIILNR